MFLNELSNDKPKKVKNIKGKVRSCDLDEDKIIRAIQRTYHEYDGLEFLYVESFIAIKHAAIAANAPSSQAPPVRP